ncbi:MAG TPA: tetratricopeptide repeat protein [Thermoanaerobaculia bacterium]|nr:tetratricopeptide repeat protein [Thermoanaerobaculia bacterium]
MKRALLPSWFLLALLALLLTTSCAHGVDVGRASDQANFGVQAARMNLWREALFRFRRAVDMNPGDAMLRNNLAVAYEATGDFEKARESYVEALKLDRSNQYIQKNFSRFNEFLGRNKKRQQQQQQQPQKPGGRSGAPPSRPPSGQGPAGQPGAPPIMPPSDRPPHGDIQ